MASGIISEHEELGEAVRGWVERNVTASRGEAGPGTDTEPERAEAWESGGGVGRLTAQGQVIELLGQRVALKRFSGAAIGTGSSARKLPSVECNQVVADYVWECHGSAAGYQGLAAESGGWVRFTLFGHSMTLYGDTTEVRLNVLGERTLGLPRDSEV